MTLAAPDIDADAEALAGDLDRFRSAVEAWIAASADELAPYTHWKDYSSFEGAVDHFRGLQRLLLDAGWTRYGWPVEVGGLGGGVRHRACLYETLWEHDVTMPEPYQILEVTGSIVAAFAPDLARRHLWDFVGGEHLWSLGLSEPDAGSDLAALRTRAVRTGDGEGGGGGYRLNGQKTWNSFGQTARCSLVLCRTGDPELRHRSLSFLLLDLDSPGVTRHPLRAQTGRNELCELFFDDVEVPATRLVGEEGDAWRMLMWAMQFERGSHTWPRQGWLHKRLERMLPGCSADDRAARRRVGETVLTLAALRVHCSQSLAVLGAGGSVGAAASVDKLLLSQAEEASLQLLREATHRSLVLGGGANDLEDRHHHLYAPAVSVFGGADEVQLDIVAERLLGLPRGGARRG